jgi:RNA polymerase sigma factor (TIGR02999 family)
MVITEEEPPMPAARPAISCIEVPPLAQGDGLLEGGTPGAAADAASAGIDPDTLFMLLRAVTHGEAGALDRLIPLVYAELRRIASRQLRRLGGTPTVSTTVLVHEAYERLAAHAALNVDDERHFYALCGRVMRQIVIDHARERIAAKRGGGILAVTLDEGIGDVRDDAELAARLAEALSQLAERDAALAELAEMAWLAGLDTDRIAALTGMHLRMVQRDLKRARAWIATAIAP